MSVPIRHGCQGDQTTLSDKDPWGYTGRSSVLPANVYALTDFSSMANQIEGNDLSEKTTVSRVTWISHPLVPSSYRVVQLVFMPEALPLLKKGWTHIATTGTNRCERFIMV